ncbi:MAG: helix-hairpin-helix domain-containing protein [Gemmatimonadota bacterium]|nr:helix-hairpin-helix domain-containing protein [Gemmatimonadota bacterium]
MTVAASPAGPALLVNAGIARRLDEVAHLLDEQGASAFRIMAYRNAAASLRTLPVPVSDLYAQEGLAGLESIPGVGHVIARAIRDQLLLGRLPLLERLRGEVDPVGAFEGIPGIGPVLAERLHHELGIGSLEDLEAAAHDGRLATLPGFGAKRLAAVTAALAERLGRARVASAPEDEPGVGEVLDVDREYREGAASGALPTIAPRRFNPARQAWLPVLHTERDDRHYTALFSNTALAHRLGRTHDWVVLYYDGRGRERQCTVVTPHSGPLRGRRTVRGREIECMAHYGLSHPGADVTGRE